MRLIPAAIVFGAAGASYVYTHDELLKEISPTNWVSEDGAAAPGETAHVEKLVTATLDEVVAIPGPVVSNFADVFRFDMTQDGVAKRWSHVTTGLSDHRYQGYRVPLVTGTSESDLAGSLTYYFDSKPRLRRITFLGTTADPNRLVSFLAQQYGFKRVQNDNPRIATYRVKYRNTGQLLIMTADALNRHQAATNYQVELSLEK